MKHNRCSKQLSCGTKIRHHWHYRELTKQKWFLCKPLGSGFGVYSPLRVEKPEKMTVMILVGSFLCFFSICLARKVIGLYFSLTLRRPIREVLTLEIYITLLTSATHTYIMRILIHDWKETTACLTFHSMMLPGCGGNSSLAGKTKQSPKTSQ